MSKGIRFERIVSDLTEESSVSVFKVHYALSGVPSPEWELAYRAEYDRGTKPPLIEFSKNYIIAHCDISQMMTWDRYITDVVVKTSRKIDAEIDEAERTKNQAPSRLAQAKQAIGVLIQQRSANP